MRPVAINVEDLSRILRKNMEICDMKDMRSKIRKKFPGLSAREENMLLDEYKFEIWEVAK